MADSDGRFEAQKENQGSARKPNEAVPAASSQSDSTSEASSSAPASEKVFIDQIRKSDRWMIALTAIIAVGGLFSSIVFGYQLREMQIGSKISEDALKISRETFIAAQRPWVSIEMNLLGPLNFNDNGAEIEIGVKLKNHGHSPAMNARNFVIFDPNATGRKGSDFCLDQRGRNLSDSARVIFPDDVIFDSHLARADNNEVKSATRRNGTISPFLTACVDYISDLDNSRHQTEVTANLLRTPKSPSDSFAITPSDGIVPQNLLHLEIIFGARKAD
jgi:hypothetical protein